jgi:hypothetical protein
LGQNRRHLQAEPYPRLTSTRGWSGTETLCSSHTCASARALSRTLSASLEEIKEASALLGAAPLPRDRVRARPLDGQELDIKLDSGVWRDAGLEPLLPKRKLHDDDDDDDDDEKEEEREGGGEEGGGKREGHKKKFTVSHKRDDYDNVNDKVTSLWHA